MRDGRILLGVVGRPHGIRGHVHVHSYAAEPDSLSTYGILTDAAGRRFALRWVASNVAELSEQIDGTLHTVTDRAAAERLVNVKLFIDRAALPEPDDEEFYLTDLIGLPATSPDGATLGPVVAVHDYGAGASLEIGGARPLLVPFTRAAVPDVDVAAGRLVVCMPAELVLEECALEHAP